MICVGIDPGITGYIAAIDDSGKFLLAAPMPVYQDGKRRRISTQQLGNILRKIRGSYEGGLRVALERVSAMPGQGVASMFGLGHSLGACEGVLGALTLPYTLVSPQSWKRRYGLTGKSHGASARKSCVACAMRLFPNAPWTGKKGHDEALGDALLIADYGRAER